MDRFHRLRHGFSIQIDRCTLQNNSKVVVLSIFCFVRVAWLGSTKRGMCVGRSDNTAKGMRCFLWRLSSVNVSNVRRPSAIEVSNAFSPLPDEAVFDECWEILDKKGEVRGRAMLSAGNSVKYRAPQIAALALEDNNVADRIRVEDAAEAMDPVLLLHALRPVIGDVSHARADFSDRFRCLDPQAVELILRDVAHVPVGGGTVARGVQLVLKAGAAGQRADEVHARGIIVETDLTEDCADFQRRSGTQLWF
jgi:hypothetical protein